MLDTSSTRRHERWEIDHVQDGGLNYLARLATMKCFLVSLLGPLGKHKTCTFDLYYDRLYTY